MVRRIEELENIRTASPLRDFLKNEVMQFIFTRSQENLVNPVPYGKSSRPYARKPTTITDTGFLLRSSSGPFWEGDTLKIIYDAPYAVDIEFGTQPHPMSHTHLITWARRKLGIRNKKRATSAAYAISKTIEKFGTDPHPFLRSAIASAIVKYNLKVTPPKF